MGNALETVWTERFEKSFEDCSNKEFVIRAIAELEDYVHDRRMNTRQAKKVKGSSADESKKYGVTLMEWDLNAAARLLFGLDEVLLLVDFSASLVHDCLDKFSRLKSGEKGAVFATAKPLPSFIRSEIERPSLVTNPLLTSLVQVRSGGDRSMFPAEKTRDWVTFMDIPQRELSQTLQGEILKSTGFKVHLILGGAGTGKTMVLRDLCVSLLLKNKVRCQFRIPSGVREFLQSEGAALPGLPPFSGEYSAILVDDPILISDALEAVEAAKQLDVPIVIAIDPIQWHQRLSVDKFEKFLQSEKPVEYHLTTNYRQGSFVGQAAVDAIKKFRSNTSEFTDRFKEQINKNKSAKFERISLDQIKFAENAGTYAFYSAAEFSLIKVLRELHRVGRFRTERIWPKVLFGAEERDSFPYGVPKLIKMYSALDESFKFHQRAFRQYKDVRGTEYESVIVFIRESTWSRIVNGVEGAKNEIWEELNAPLTFLTRAENRCIVFEVPDQIQFLPFKTSVHAVDDQKIESLFEQWFERETSRKVNS